MASPSLKRAPGSGEEVGGTQQKHEGNVMLRRREGKSSGETKNILKYATHGWRVCMAGWSRRQSGGWQRQRRGFQ